MVKYEEAIKYVMKDAVAISYLGKTCKTCLGATASFDSGMIILIQRLNFIKWLN